MNISIGFVIYLPEISILDRLKIATESGCMVYIYDNSPKVGFVRDFCKKLPNCKYLTCGKNVGLGVGISSVCAQAFYDSYSVLLFFDQDTFYNIETINFIQNFYKSNLDLESCYSAIVFNSKSNHIKGSNYKNEIKEVTFTISSGSLFFLKNLDVINWHNPNYFVDCVDYEFCLNSNNHHFKIGEYSNTPGFDHQKGQPDVKYKVFGEERFMRKYSRKRFFDYLLSSCRLIIDSIRTMNLKYLNASIRSLLIYLYFQIIIRIIKIYK